MRGPTTMGSRLPAQELSALPRGEILKDPETQVARNVKRDPGNLWGCGIGRVVAIDPATLQVTLRVVQGSPDDQPMMPVAVPMPGAGRRHFLGTMPEVGDYAMVAWAPHESLAPRARTPVIVGWVVPGVNLGMLAALSCMLSRQDADLDDEMVRAVLGPDAPARYRFMGAGPGEPMMSSAGGADLLCTDGVRALGAGGSELAARGDDSALVRGVTFHEAAAGVRVYAGPARRDALLPPVGVLASDLPEAERRGHAPGELLPDPALDRGPGGTGRPLEPVDPELDPYSVWQRAGWADGKGLVSEAAADAVADPATQVVGGRRLRTVPSGDESGPEDLRFAEWRVEAAFEARPLLPATDVADGVDAERIPDAQGNAPPERAQVRMAMGTAVGNDPYGNPDSYARALVPRVRTQGVPDPRVEAASAQQDYSLLAAWLLEVDSTLPDAPPCFLGIDRGGRMKASLAGGSGEASLDLVASGGLQASLGGSLALEAELGVSVRDRGGLGVQVESDRGPVAVRGGGPGTVPGGPSVRVEAVSGDVLVRAADTVQARGSTVLSVGDSVRSSATQDLTLDAGGRLGMNCSIGAAFYSSRSEEAFAGNKGPLHKRTYSPSIPKQVCEDVTYESGDRNETFKMGSHTTTVTVGDVTYKVTQGAIHLQAAQTKLDMDNQGMRGEAGVGDVSMDAKAGSITLKGLKSATLSTSTGGATVSGLKSVYLGATVIGPEMGAIISSGSIDPLTGSPFSTWGMGAQNHTIGMPTG